MYDLFFRTNRLNIIKADLEFLEDYYISYTKEIAKYQYLDSFKDINEAKETLTFFLNKMENDFLLELMIIDDFSNFIGILEAVFISESEIEIGIWIKDSVQSLGYGYESLSGLIEYLNFSYEPKIIFCEVDERNNKSKALISKFDSTKEETNNIVTDSGKILNLTKYRIKNETAW